MMSMLALLAQLFAVALFGCGDDDPGGDSDAAADSDSDTDTDTDIDGDTDADSDTDTTQEECAFDCLSQAACDLENGTVYEQMVCESGTVCCDLGEDTDTISDYWQDGVCPPTETGYPASADCKDIVYEGCCDEEGRVIWCYNNLLYCQDCAAEDKVCTWATSPYGDHEYYACRDEYGGSDPSGVFPENCDGTWPDIDGGPDSGE